MKTKAKERKLNSKARDKNSTIYHWNGKEELKREVKKPMKEMFQPHFQKSCVSCFC